MAASMAEMMALLRGPTRASSSSTPPLAHGSTVDPALWVLPTHVPKSNVMAAPAPTAVQAPVLPSTHILAVYPIDTLQSQSTIPAAISLPPMTILAPDPTMFAPPFVSMPVPVMIYTVPPPMVFSASSAPAPTQTTEPFPFPTLQSHIGLPYQAPPPINIPFPESGTPTHAAPVAPPSNILLEAETEQKRRMKKMEETIGTL
ncbi:proline-rich receptor-like protein kinase PERK8 [Punica granatum]|uniref:Proline-rich receptor-like protein kinase PERK8 n=1 Tax=Punica granatum TaxID=22663 RepID=A0A6P8DKD3_PUNGR|nr:proline-rich receptor-like protein kinase PERK8 [Punica granatum]